MNILTHKTMIRTFAALSLGFSVLFVSGCTGSQGINDMASKSPEEQAKALTAQPDPAIMAKKRAEAMGRGGGAPQNPGGSQQGQAPQGGAPTQSR